MATITYDASRIASPAAMRLTPRGRLVIAAVALALALGGVMAGQTAAADVPGEATPVVAHTVERGQTLWSIASAVAGPGQDVRDVIEELIVVNGLPSSDLRVGQRILVPTD